jgi:hypothetical protein
VSLLPAIFIVAFGDSLPIAFSNELASISSLFTDSLDCLDCDDDELSVISNLNVMSVVNIGYFLQNSSMRVLVKSLFTSSGIGSVNYISVLASIDSLADSSILLTAVCIALSTVRNILYSFLLCRMINGHSPTAYPRMMFRHHGDESVYIQMLEFVSWHHPTFHD